jgi:hypothetical protein
VLPAYNGAEYLRPAIDSILNQSIGTFELLIINDGSSDNSAEIIRSYSDPRIRFLEQKNQGLSATLNRGIQEARGKWIARQDQDDISYPARFAEQIGYLNKNRDCALVGSWARIVSTTGKDTGRCHKPPSSDAEIRAFMCYDNPFVHSSVIFRKEAAIAAGLYSTDKTRQPPEDFEFWSRLMKHGKLANIPRVLLDYREVPTSMSRTGQNPFLDKVIQISAENMHTLSGGMFAVGTYLEITSVLHGKNRVGPPPAVLAQIVNTIRKALTHGHKKPVQRVLSQLQQHYLDATGRTPWWRKIVRIPARVRLKVFSLLRETAS